MATHDYVIDNSTGANVRADINLVLQAILTNNSSSSAPSTTAAYMWWADTTNGVLKIRNSSNNDWVELLQLDGTLTLEDGSASTPALAFRDDLNTGIFSSAADTFNVATAGVERMELGATTIFNEDGADVDFRIEGDTQANLFYVDAGNDRIGIGTSSPTASLQVKGGEIHFGDSNSSSSSIGKLSFGGSSGELDIKAHSTGGNTVMKFTTSASGTPAERMRLDSNGVLGVGTSSPRDSTGIHLSKGGGETIIELQRNQTNTTGNIGIINFTASDGHSVANIGAFGDGDNEGAYISFKTTSAASDNSPFGTNTTEGLRINSNQSINAQGVYNDTTSSSANVNVHTDGHIRRSTSSRRYKNTITDATHGLTELLKLKSVTFKGNEDGDTVFGGLIAEDVHDVGLTEFVQYDKDNQPDALAYGNMIALCVKAIQELTARVATLESA